MEDAHVAQAGLLGAGVSAGALPLLLHEDAESVLIDFHALLGGHLQSQVDGETIGVVEGEGAVAGQYGPAGSILGLGPRRVQNGRTRGQGPAEGVLLGVSDLGDSGPVGVELRVGGLHRLLRHGQKCWQ